MSQQDITADFVATTFTATKSAIAKTQFISQLAEIEQRHPNLINEQIIDAVIDFVLKEQLKDRQAMDPIPTVNELGVVFGMRRDLAEATLNKVPQLILSIKAKVRWNPPLLLPYALLHAAVSADSSLANREVVKLLLEGPPEGAAAIKSWSESVKLLIVQRSDLFTDEDLVAIAKLTAVFSDSRSESQKAKSPIFTMILEGRPDLAAALWKSILPEYIRYPDGYSWAAQEIIKKHPDVISTEELHQILDTRKGNNRPPYSLLPTITEHASGVFDEAVAVKLAGLLLQYPDSNYQETRHMDELLAKRPEFGAAVFAEIEQKFDLNNIGEDFALKRAGLHLFESVLQHAPTAITVEFVKNLSHLVMDYRGSHQWSYHGDYRNQYFGDLLLKDILTQRPDLIDPAYEILTEPSAFRRKTKAEQTRIMRAGSFEHFDVLLEVATLKPELAKAVLGLIQKCHTRSLRNLRRYLHVAKLAVIDPKLLRVATSILSTAELKDGYDGESIYLAYKHMLNAQPSFGDADYIQNAVRKAATTKDDYLYSLSGLVDAFLEKRPDLAEIILEAIAASQETDGQLLVQHRRIMRGILDVRPDLAKAVLDQALLHLSHEDDSHGTAIKGVINIVTKVAEIKPTLISANMMRAITRRAHAADKYHELAEKLLPILDARPQLAVAVWAETQSFASGTEDNHHAYAFITKLFERYPALVTESRLRVMTKGVSAEVIDNDRHAFGAAMKAALSHKPELAKTIDEATPLRRVMGQLLPQPQPAGV